MNSRDIIEKLAKDKAVEKLACGMSRNTVLISDLVSEVYLILLEMDGRKIVESYEKGWILYLIKKILNNQLNSSTSPFFIKYRKLILSSGEITDRIRQLISEDDNTNNIKL